MARNFHIIEEVWTQSGVWPDFLNIMIQALGLDPSQAEVSTHQTSAWKALPGLCCQATGGDPRWVEPFSAAWSLFYLAAHLMDSVEDQDLPDEWWRDLGSSVALNAASGLYFTASQALARLYTQEDTRQRADEIVTDFYRGFLVMCSGQHRDLTTPKPSLEQCWEIAAAKSGEFFAMACRAGARFATDNPDILREFSRFGYHIGLLIQLQDDLDDLRLLNNPPPNMRVSLHRSIPVAFALNVLSQADGAELLKALSDAGERSSAADKAFQLIEHSGAGLYLVVEMERHKGEARSALALAQPAQPAADKLNALIDSF